MDDQDDDWSIENNTIAGTTHHISAISPPVQKPRRTDLQAVYAVFLLCFMSNFGIYCSEVPLLRLIERRICDQHYASGAGSYRVREIDESHCKIPEIQNQLAFFMGYKVALDAIPPLLTSLWYGTFANKIGRRSVTALACTGELLNLVWVLFVAFDDTIRDIRWAWMAAVFLFIGAGQYLLLAMFNTIVADAVDESKRAQYLSVLHAISLVNQLVATPIGAALMKLGLPIPFVVVVGIYLLRYPVVWYTKETGLLRQSKRDYDGMDTQQQTEEQDQALPRTDQPLLGGSQHQPRGRSLVIIESLRYLWGRHGIPFVFLCFVIKRISFASQQLMFQYISETWRRPLAATSWVYIPLSLSATVMTSVVLPTLLQFLKARGVHSMTVNIWAIRGSLSIIIIGFALFWLSRNVLPVVLALILQGLGEGLEPSLQALASAIVVDTMHSNLFATLSVLDTIAKLLGRPIMAAAFAVRGGSGQTYGLCFLLSAVLFLVLLCMSFAPSLKKIETQIQPED